ncbi:MAG: pyrimidine dimer DNA glycosylase/endonuclease V [Thermoplasmatota archaeon]
MRLWSLHPKYLDSKGLVAGWREALLAKAVLRGETRGYTQHPQLERFNAQPGPVAAIDAYLAGLFEESVRRGYNFNAAKFTEGEAARVPVTIGQLAFERDHLAGKLLVRDPTRLARLPLPGELLPHPLFKVVPGDVESWERP